ncbi:Undecaprenyl-phosphate mannosyltransferase [compost metagenome]
MIIPCYNEEASLPLLLAELKGLVMPDGYELIPLVVNDCSKDRTLQVARDHGVKVLDLPNNLGIGGAVQSGICYAKRNYFDMAVQVDGDGQHPPAELPKLLQAMEQEQADMVIGSRFIENEGFRSSFMRRIGIRYFFNLNMLLTGNRIYDSTSGFRLMGERAIALGADHYPDDYPEPESLIIFSRAGLKIVETPVRMSHRRGGKSSIGSFLSLYYGIKVTIGMLFSFIRKPR